MGVIQNDETSTSHGVVQAVFWVVFSGSNLPTVSGRHRVRLPGLRPLDLKTRGLRAFPWELFGQFGQLPGQSMAFAPQIAAKSDK